MFLATSFLLKPMHKAFWDKLLLRNRKKSSAKSKGRVDLIAMDNVSMLTIYAHSDCLIREGFLSEIYSYKYFRVRYYVATFKLRFY